MKNSQEQKEFALPFLNKQFTDLNEKVSKTREKIDSLVQAEEAEGTFTSLEQIKLILSDIPALAGMASIVALNLFAHPSKIPDSLKVIKDVTQGKKTESVHWE